MSGLNYTKDTLAHQLIGQIIEFNTLRKIQ